MWFGVIGVFAFSFIFLWFSYFQGADGVIHWEKIQEQKVLESTIHTFNVGPFELSVPAENYVIIEYFNGSALSINEWSSLIFVAVLVFSSVVLLTVITTLERFWYFAGMGLFILFVVSLRLEVVAIFAQRNQIPAMGIMSVFVILSYYFNAIRPSVSFRNRFLLFALITVVTGVIIYFSAGVRYPMLHLSVTGYTAAMVLSVIFILMVAHEIPAAFVYISSQGNSKSLRHFSIISTIYIVNVIITCLHELGTIHWNFVYLNIYLLLSVSAVLGLWGFKLRESIYSNIFSFAPYGAFFFAALATICFVTIGQLLGTSNDPALKIIRDVIIFSHVGYGVIFLTYIFSNFILMMAQNIPVYKVLYKPNRMPHFTFRLAGLIMTLGFVFYSNWKEYVYHSIAGFYNNIGDLYERMDLPSVREAYYEQGKNYGFGNNHANYELGIIKTEKLDMEGARRNYELANGSRPTVYSLVNEGNTFIWEVNFFDAIKTYEKGIHKEPGSGELRNNLGSAFARLHNLDSAVYYLNQARTHDNSKSTAETNFFAMLALEHLPVKADSVLKIFDKTSDATKANALALATIQSSKLTVPFDVHSHTRLDLYSATLLNNYIIQHVKEEDTAFVNKAYHIAADSLNADYAEALKSSLAFSYYHLGNVTKALNIMAELAYISQSHQGKFNYLMGLWALEQHNPELASSYFNYAVDSDYKEGKLYKAIALSEAQQIDEAIVAWDTVSHRKNEQEQAMAASMLSILKMNLKEASSLADQQKYQFCRYRLKVNDTLAFNTIVNTFQQNDYKAQALLDMAQRQFDWDNMPAAIRYFNKIGGLKLTNKRLYEDVQHMELLMLARRKELKALVQQLGKDVTFDSNRRLEKIYFTALQNEASGDTTMASKNYEIVGKYNPYFEDAVIAAADYFRDHSSDKMKAYTILVDAIQVNTSSARLLRAYAGEALRLGFNEYALSALQRADALYMKAK
jgi:Flp pilus assembly protein TadD